MRTLQELAKTLAFQGRTEEAIAALQGGLEAHPKSGEFQALESLLQQGHVRLVLDFSAVKLHSV